MKLIIQQFKCFSEHTEFEFLDNGFNLLSGPSGAGKTTIFNAIYWCLYGGLGFKSNKLDNTKSTYVIIIFNNFWIKRTGAKQLQVKTIDNQDITNESAQGYIDKLFGNKNLWLSSSYIQQGERNVLLSLAGEDKFSTLHEIAFGADVEINRPEFYINRLNSINETVKNTISQKNLELKSKETEYNLKYNNYMTVYNQNLNLESSELSLSELEQNKTDIETKIIELKLNVEKTLQIEAEINSINNMINSINQELENLVMPEKVDSDQLNLLEQQLLKQKHIKELQKRLEQIKDIPDNYQELLEIARRQLQNKQNFIKKCQTYKVDPSHIVIELANLKNIDYENKLANYNQYCLEKQTYDLQVKQILTEAENIWKQECQNLKDQHQQQMKEKIEIENKNKLLSTDYNNKVKEINYKKQHYQEKLSEYNRVTELRSKLTDNYNQILEQISSINFDWWIQSFPDLELNNLNINNKKHQYKDLFCPHCGGSINYNNNALHKGHYTEKEQKDNLANLGKTENDLKIYLNYNTELERIKNSLDNLVVPTLPEDNQEELPILNLLEVPIVQNLTLPSFIKPSIPNPPIAVEAPPPNPHERILQLQELIPDIGLESIQHYQNIIDKYQLGYELDSIKQELQNYPNYLDIDEEHVANYRLKIKEYQEYQTKFNYLTDRLKELRIPTPPLESSLELKNKILNLEAELLTISQHIKFCTINTYLINEKTVIENLALEKYDIETYIYNLLDYEHSINYLKQYVSEISNSSLEEIVSDINVTVNRVLEELFDEGITVLICTTKELKNKNTKLLVNLQIQYQGDIYDNIKDVSGGQAQRISFALTVALAKICDSPVLLLDECIDNFEHKIREKCLKILRVYLPDKIIIHITHFGNNGRYDKNIDLGREVETYEL